MCVVQKLSVSIGPESRSSAEKDTKMEPPN